MHIEELDPSMAFGFMLSSRSEFEDFCSHSEKIFADSLPLYSITAHQLDYASLTSLSQLEDDEGMVLL